MNINRLYSAGVWKRSCFVSTRLPFRLYFKLTIPVDSVVTIEVGMKLCVIVLSSNFSQWCILFLYIYVIFLYRTVSLCGNRKRLCSLTVVSFGNLGPYYIHGCMFKNDSILPLFSALCLFYV